MATVNVTASTNINTLTYASGDTLALLNTVNPSVRLTIDAQTAADVTKIGTYLPGLFSISNTNAEVYITNTSTTVPLVLKMNGELANILNGPYAKFTTRGAWISLGSGTGLDNQTLSVASVGGVLIDNPPFVQIETSSGSGVYMTLLNIGGSYNDGYSGSGLTPTAYPNSKTFASVGTTIDNGLFFTFDEQNSTIHFGSAAGGGWVPPNGSNIRYPNIHITGTARPNATTSSRCRFTATSAVLDMQITAFSDRWGLFGSQFWPQSFKLRQVGFNVGGTGLSNTTGAIDIDGMYCPMEIYATSTKPGFSMQSATGTVSIDNVYVVTNDGIGFALSGIQSLTKLGTIYSSPLAKASSFRYPIQFTQVYSTSGLTGGQLTVGPFYLNGGPLNMAYAENIRIYGFYFSDFATGIASATNSSPWIFNVGGCKNITIEKMRLISGGTPSTGLILSSQTSGGISNFALKDIVINGQNPQTLATWQTGFSSGPISRYWMNVANLTNFTSSQAQGGSSSYTYTYPIRISDYLSDVSSAINMSSGMLLEGVTGSITAVSGVVDAAPFHLLRTTGKTVGTLHMYPAIINYSATQIVVTGGVDGTDYYMTTAYNMPSTGLTAEYTLSRPIRGVTSATGATMTINGTSASSGVAYYIRFRAYGDTTWGSYQLLSSSADFVTAFDAMSGYSSSVGFQAQFKIVTSSAVAGRTCTSVTFTGLTLDGSWTPTESGFIQASVTGVTTGSDVAVINNTTPASPVLIDYAQSVSGSYSFEYPYAFDGTGTDYKIVSRQAGYNEYSQASTMYQQGETLPVSMTASESTTDADVVTIDSTGSTLTTAVTDSHTLAELYQDSQWWAHQRTSMIYPVPVTSNGVGGYTSVYDINVTSTKVLNGTGTLFMNGKTLSTEFSGGVAYTYTNGTWSQETTVPAFNGGTVTLGAENTYTYTMGGNTTFVLTPSTNGVHYVMGGSTFTGTITLHNATANTCVVELPSGTSYSTTGNTGGAITVTTPAVYQSVVITGLVANSRVQIYDTTSSTELYNAVVAGTSHTWTDSVAAAASRAIRVRISNCITTTAYDFVDSNIGTCGTTSADASVSYLANQSLDTTYNSNAIDGSTVTGITIAPSPARVSINIAGGSVTWASIYAYQVYWLYGATGIADEAAFIAATDTANYILTGFSVKNTNANPLSITGGWGRDSITLTIAGCIDSAGSTGNIYAEPDHVVAFATGSGLTSGEQAQLATAAGVATTIGTPAGASVSADIAAIAGGSAPTVTQIRQEMDANSTKLALVDMPISGVAAANRSELTPELTPLLLFLKNSGVVAGVNAVNSPTGIDNSDSTGITITEGPAGTFTIVKKP